MDNLLKIFSENVRFYRKKAGLTQESLAVKCGLHRTYIGAIERGIRNISIKNVEKIALALEIKPFKLFQENDKS